MRWMRVIFRILRILTSTTNSPPIQAQILGRGGVCNSVSGYSGPIPATSNRTWVRPAPLAPKVVHPGKGFYETYRPRTARASSDGGGYQPRSGRRPCVHGVRALYPEEGSPPQDQRRDRGTLGCMGQGPSQLASEEDTEGDDGAARFRLRGSAGRKVH